MKKQHLKKIIEMIFIIIALIAIPAISAYMLGKAYRNIFLCIVLCMSFGLTIIRLWFDSSNEEKNRSKSFEWFGISFIIGIIGTSIFTFFPVNGWFVLPLSLAFILTSDFSLAVVAYTGLLAICSYIGDASIVVFVIYLLTGLFVISLFNNFDKDIKFHLPFISSILTYSIALIAKEVFYAHGDLTVDSLVVPIINIFISAILMLAILRIFVAKVVDREKGEYIDINDQEFELLAKYKDENPGLYYNAIHTAYFSEKIARLLGMDIDLAKNGGYYHKIIANECNTQEKTLEEVCKKYKFPDKAVKLLQEINYKDKPIKMKETAVVYLCDAIISSILFLQEKEENTNIDYATLAKALINRKKESGVLNESELSFNDIGELEKVFIGEKLYYDFLRRK